MNNSLSYLLRAAIAERIFPGAVLLALRGDSETVISAGTTMYDDPASTPVRPDTIYDIASITKPITATAALILYDAGALDLDAPAAYYLPGFAARNLLVRHLLTHTSGLDLRLSALRHLAADAIRAAVYATLPLHPPGSMLAYTNINSLILGEIVARLFGAPLDQALDSLLFRPLGMQTTRFRPPADWRAQIAPSEWDHAWRGGLVQGVVHDESAYALGGVAGHAGLFSTAGDLARFLRLWLHGGAWGQRSILRESTVALALRDHTAHLPALNGRSAQSGLGWMLDRSYVMGRVSAGSFGHTGFTGAAIIGVPAHDLGLVLLSNRTYPHRTPPPYRHHAVTAAIMDALV